MKVYHRLLAAGPPRNEPLRVYPNVTSCLRAGRGCPWTMGSRRRRDRRDSVGVRVHHG